MGILSSITSTANKISSFLGINEPKKKPKSNKSTAWPNNSSPGTDKKEFRLQSESSFKTNSNGSKASETIISPYTANSSSAVPFNAPKSTPTFFAPYSNTQKTTISPFSQFIPFQLNTVTSNSAESSSNYSPTSNPSKPPLSESKKDEILNEYIEKSEKQMIADALKDSKKPSVKPSNYKAVDAPKNYIDNVNKAADNLDKEKEGGDQTKIDAAYTAYKEALMDEIGASCSIGNNTSLGYSVFLQDSKAIEVATKKVAENHADRNNGAYITATIISKQAEYNAGGPDAKPDAKKSTAALKKVGDQLGTLDDSQGAVKDLVLKDPSVKNYYQVIINEASIKVGGEGLKSFAESVDKLSKSSYNMATHLIDTSQGVQISLPENSKLYSLISKAEATENQPIDMAALDTIYTSVQGTPIAKKTQDVIVSAMCRKITTNPTFTVPSSNNSSNGFSDNQVLDFFKDKLFPQNNLQKNTSTQIGNIYVKNEKEASPFLYTAMVDQLEKDSNTNPVVVDKLKKMQSDAMKFNMQKIDHTIPADSSISMSEPAVDKVPENLVQQTNDAKKRYDEAKSGGDKNKEAKALTDLHKCLGKEINYAKDNLKKNNVFLSEKEIDDSAIKVVSQQYHEGQEGENLLPFTQASAIIDSSETKTQISDKMETISAGLSPYRQNKEVINQVITDTRTQGNLDSITQHIKGMQDKEPEERIHYLAQMVNAGSGSRELGEALLDKAFPQIKGDLKNLDTHFFYDVDDYAPIVRDLCDIASPMKKTSDSGIQKNYTEMVTLTEDYLNKVSMVNLGGPSWEGNVVSVSIGKYGADPALLLDAAGSSNNSIAQKMICDGVKKGVEEFLTKTFPDEIKKSDESVAQLEFLKSEGLPFIDTCDPEAMSRYYKYINDYCSKHPEIQENADKLNDMSVRTVDMLDSLTDNQMHQTLEKNGVAEDIDKNINDLLNDPARMGVVADSDRAVNAFNAGRNGNDLKSTLKKLFSGTGNVRLTYQRAFGIVRMKNAALEATRLARQGDYSDFYEIMKGDVDAGVELLESQYGKKGIPEYLLTNEKIDGFYQKLTSINNANMEYEHARMKLEFDKSHGIDISNSQREFNAAADKLENAIKNKPGVDLTFDVTTTEGKVVRGFGLVANAGGLALAIADPNIPNRGKVIVVGAASTAQNIALMASMAKRKEAYLNNFFNGGTQSASFKYWNEAVSSLDNLGDKMILLGPLLSLDALKTDLSKKDWYGATSDSISTIGGLAAFMGTQIGKTPAGTALTKTGGILAGVGAVMIVGRMAYDFYDIKYNFPHRFENDESKRFWKDVVGMSDADQIIKCNDKGFGTGVAMQADALMNGYDLNNPQDLATYKKYIDDMSLSDKNIYFEGLRKWMGECNLSDDKYPSPSEINDYVKFVKFQHNLQEDGISLPPIRLADLTSQPVQPTYPKQPPAVTVTRYKPGNEATDTLWGITGNNLDTILTDEQKKEIAMMHLTPEQIALTYGLPMLYTLNPDEHFDDSLRDGVPSPEKGDPDTLHEGDKIIVGR